MSLDASTLTMTYYAFNFEGESSVAKNALEEKERRKVGEQIKDIREMVKTLEKAGIEVPSSLTKSLKYLQIALDTGEDLGKSFEDAGKSLAALEKDLLNACKNVDDALQTVCEARVARMWQVRSVKFTLDFRNPESVSAKFIKKTVQRYLPSKICRHWEYCRKEVGK